MGFSELATVIIESPFKSSREGTVIDSVAIHTMAGDLTAQQCGTLFQQSGKNASSNYGIDSNGVIGGYVDETERAWTTSNKGVDVRSITIEVASTTASEPFQPSDEAYESLLRLLVDICRRNHITSLKWKGDKNYAIAASQGGPVDQQNMFVHRWFASKSCPGDWLFSHHNEIATEVNNRLNSGDAASTSSTSASTDAIQITSIDYTAINCYIVTIDRNSKVDFSKLSESKIVGALVEAGYRYEKDGRVTNKFDNPNLATQIAELNKYSIPYGLYTTCRARNTVEAKDEMYYFSFPARKYGAPLGVWLNLEIVRNNIYNTPILKQYRKELVRLGFKHRMGVMCDKDMIQHIEWSNDNDDTKESFKNDYFLWLVEHVESVDELDTLLDPTFFDIDGEG